MAHILPKEYSQVLKEERWHTTASASGMGTRKSLQVRVGKLEYRVIAGKTDRVKYQGTSATKAVEVYNEL